MKRMFLGYDNISDTRKEKGAQKREVDGFVDALVRAGFPEKNILTMPTGLWIDVDGTTLTVQESYDQLVTTKRLCCGDIELAKSERQPISFGGASLIYTLYPDAIKQLPQVLQSEVLQEDESLSALMGMKLQ